MARILMLCHDQHLDRRVIAQASSLIKIGHHVTLLALSFDCKRCVEILTERIQLVRIPLSSIIPGNRSYCAYVARQASLNRCLQNAACRFSRCAPFINRAFHWCSRVNWQIYRMGLLRRFHNISLGDPLPFCTAFLSEGQKHPSDLIQVHDLPALEAGVLLASEWDVPLVYDAHELYPEQRTFSSAQRRICSDAEARLLHHARLVFTVNQSIADEMSRRYRIDRPVVLLNAVDPPEGFDPTENNELIRNILGLPPSRRILLYQGGFAPHRNLMELVHAFAMVRTQDVDLVMMGFGDFGSTLRRQAEKLGLCGRRVHFLPAVPQPMLIRYSASADMGIIPYPHVDLNSRYCTPNKLFEFIQAALPILANDSPELRRFVSAEGFGLNLPMHSPEQIASAVDTAFSSSARSRWKINLMQRRHLYTWAQQERIYLEAMMPLLEQSARLSNLVTGVQR